MGYPFSSSPTRITGREAWQERARQGRAKQGHPRPRLGPVSRLLEYKVAARGGELVKVNPAYTSRTCRVCGHLSADNRKSQALFFCVACGHAEHADVHASKNILTAGRAAWAVRTAEGRASGQPEAAACEEDVRHLPCASVTGAASKARGLAPTGQAQEPTETTMRGRAPCVAR